MKKYLIVSFLILLVPVFAVGQDQGIESQGYAFAGVGRSFGASALHLGGGIEADLYKGLGFGLDLGYMGATEELSSGIGILSLDGRYAFPSFADSRLTPYISSGYSLFFRDGTANAVNFGGGVDYWFAEKFGLKLEFRDHIATNCSRNCSAYQFRVGVSFR